MSYLNGMITNNIKIFVDAKTMMETQQWRSLSRQERKQDICGAVMKKQ